jgi:hypothetical protein
MKYGGDVAYLAKLVEARPPNRSYNANTITHTLDLRWSKQFQGLVAYALVKEVRPYLHNEKSIIEVDCILNHGPRVSPHRPHPFVECGAIRIRRGVWHWPKIEDNKLSIPLPIAPKYQVMIRRLMDNQPEPEHTEMREPNTIYVGKKPTNG